MKGLTGEVKEGWLDILATAARIAVDEGHFRDDLDPRQFAHDLYSIYLGHHHFARLMRDPAADRHTQQAFDELIARSRA